MPFEPRENEDSISNLFRRMVEFKRIEPKLVENKDNLEQFEHWFDEACRTDIRSCVLFVRENYSTFGDDVKRYVKGVKPVGKYVDFDD